MKHRRSQAARFVPQPMLTLVTPSPRGRTEELVRFREIQGQLPHELVHRQVLFLAVGGQPTELDVIRRVAFLVVDAIQANRRPRPALAKLEGHLLAGITVFACLFLPELFEAFKSQRELNALPSCSALFLDESEAQGSLDGAHPSTVTAVSAHRPIPLMQGFDFPAGRTAEMLRSNFLVPGDPAPLAV